VNVELVTIGTELLLGFTVDTNAAELAQGLAATGVHVVRRATVRDDGDAIRTAVDEALARTGAVITTGGLGPTRDDITKTAIAELLGRRLVLDEQLLAALEDRFRRVGRWPMPAVNRSQAEVPEGALALPNRWGTAPGLWLEDGPRLVVMLPGVPREMRGLLAESVLPRLARRTGGTDAIRSVVVRTTGIPESALAERLAHLEDTLPPLTLAYLPAVTGVDLRLTAWQGGADRDVLLAQTATRLAEACGPHCYGRDGDDLAAVVLALLRAHARTLAVAESCTGGLVGARLTAIPGASDVFVGGVVAYDNRIKRGLLGVPEPVLEAHGAVSEEAACAMVSGAQRAFDAWAAIAVTGIAGPSGGTPEKPVGTVWLAAAAGERVTTRRRVFPGDREEIRQRSAQAALDLLRREL